MSFFSEAPMPPYTEALAVLILSSFAFVTRKHDGQQLAVSMAAALGLGLLLVLWQQRKADAEELAWRKLKVCI